MNVYKCEYCMHNFSRKPNLLKHQKTAKYCLELQAAWDGMICEFCYKEFSTKQKLQHHYSCCDGYYKGLKEIKLELCETQKQLFEKEKQMVEIIERYEKHLTEANQTIERLASRAIDRPSNTRNKTVNNMNLVPLTTEHIQRYLPQLTREHIEAGSSGYAQFAVDYPLKDTLVCIDHARKKWRFKNENGEIVDDPKGQMTTEKFFQSIIDRNDELIKEYIDELFSLSEETKDTNRVIDLYRKITELNDTSFRCNDTANGKDTEFKQGFINGVTKLLDKMKI